MASVHRPRDRAPGRVVTAAIPCPAGRPRRSGATGREGLMLEWPRRPPRHPLRRAISHPPAEDIGGGRLATSCTTSSPRACSPAMPSHEAAMLDHYGEPRVAARRPAAARGAGPDHDPAGPGGGPGSATSTPPPRSHFHALYHLAGATYSELFEAWVRAEPMLAEGAARNPDRAAVRTRDGDLPRSSRSRGARGRRGGSSCSDTRTSARECWRR